MPDSNSMGRKIPGDEKEVSLDTQSTAEAFSINGKTHTMGEIDTRAREMMSMTGGEVPGLTASWRDLARREVIQGILRWAVIDNKATELHISISQEEVDKELNLRLEKIKGDKETQDLMKSMNISEEKMLDLVRHELLFNAVQDSVTKDIEVPKDKNPEDLLNAAFQKWLDVEILKLDVKILNPEIEKIMKFKSPEDMPIPTPPPASGKSNSG